MAAAIAVDAEAIVADAAATVADAVAAIAVDAAARRVAGDGSSRVPREARAVKNERSGMETSGGAVYAPLDPSVHTLGNGLRVVCEHLPYVHSASLGVWIRTGSGHEDAAQAGISHFIEHLLFKGTETRTARQIMDAVEGRGGQLNAFTTREYTCYYARVLDQHVGSAFEILADILKHSTYFDLDKERNVILEEISSSRDVPEDYVHDLLTELAWRDHPLGRPIAGYEETVSAATLETVREYRDTWYTPENMIVSIVGRFDEAAFLRQVEDEFGGLPAARVPALNGAPMYHAGQQIERRAIAQDHLLWCFPGVSITDPRRYAYDLLCSALGGGSTSRLFERIREQEGLAYAVYSFNSMLATGGLLGFYAAVAPENLQHTLDLSSEELRRLRDVPLGDEELTANREQLKGGLLLALESTFSRMSRMARSLIYQGRIVPVSEVLEKLDRVTAPEVQAAAAAIFTEPNSAVTVLGPAPEQPLALSL
jgi:predicted Zn-dependent peptidase